MKIGEPILLRTTNLQFDLHPGQQLRLLNVHISIPDEDGIDDKGMPIVVTMGASSEAFQLQYLL